MLTWASEGVSSYPPEVVYVCFPIHRQAPTPLFGGLFSGLPTVLQSEQLGASYKEGLPIFVITSMGDANNTSRCPPGFQIGQGSSQPIINGPIGAPQFQHWSANSLEQYNSGAHWWDSIQFGSVESILPWTSTNCSIIHPNVSGHSLA